MYLFFQQSYNFVHQVANFRQLKQAGVLFFFLANFRTVAGSDKKEEEKDPVRDDKCGSKDFLWKKCAKVTRF
jgi:hypothetical protein